MSHQVPWNKIIVEEFISHALLSEDEEMVLRTRAKGWTRIQQAEKLGMSLSTVDRLIATLKRKYDNVQKYNALLPPRRSSAEEVYMDTH